MRWIKLSKSRLKCGELVFVTKPKGVYIERCGVKAIWAYGSLGSRCEEHKKFIESLEGAARLALSSRTERKA